MVRGHIRIKSEPGGVPLDRSRGLRRGRRGLPPPPPPWTPPLPRWGLRLLFFGAVCQKLWCGCPTLIFCGDAHEHSGRPCGPRVADRETAINAHARNSMFFPFVSLLGSPASVRPGNMGHECWFAVSNQQSVGQHATHCGNCKKAGVSCSL